MEKDKNKRDLLGLVEGNGMYRQDLTLYRWFEEQVLVFPDRVALVYGESEVTYKELQRLSRWVAGCLRAKGMEWDEPVAIMVERSLEMMVGVLGIMGAGGAYLPIDAGSPVERIAYLLKDGGVRFCLTQRRFLSIFQGLGMGVEVLELQEGGVSGVEEVSLETMELGVNHGAYIIYTSGSTGRPKGVIVEHGSTVNLLTALSRMYPLKEVDRYLQNTSFIFDVSVTELFGWIPGGSRLVIPGQDDHRDPQRVMDIISRTGVTHVNFVPSMFQAFLQVLEHEPVWLERMSRLRYIFLAGEALSPVLVKRFRGLDREGRVRLENLYGPTEGTVYATGYSLREWEVGTRVPIGWPLPNVELVILDQAGQEVSPGETGELYIGGVCVARGYLNNPGLTAEKFILKGRVEKGGAGFGYFYRTGDLGRWLPDGSIDFLGRVDHQVKIRGIRVELGEIETQVLSHKYVKEAVVSARKDESGGTYLCGYIVVGEGGEHVDGQEMREYLEQRLPGYMVPAYWVFLEKMPLTPTGKIDRKMLPEPKNIEHRSYVAPGNEVEEVLVEIWARALGVGKEYIGIEDHFFHIGGHSLKGTGVLLDIHREFNVKLSLEEFFSMPTVRQLSGYIMGELPGVGEKYEAIEPVEEVAYYPLSPAQRRLFILDRVESGSINYNIPVMFGLDEEPDLERLEATLQLLIRRHESFRTSFSMVDEMPVQYVHKEVEFRLKRWEGVIPREFIRAFDLSRAPLLRAGVFKSGNKWVLVVDMHHIIADGVSLEIFQRELVEGYDGKELPGVGVRYRDYCQWLNSEVNRERVRQQEGYWLAMYGSEVQVLQLPYDFARPVLQDFSGEVYRFNIGEMETGALHELAEKENVTLYVVLLGVYSILLSRLSRQEDLVVGMPTAGRRHVDVENTIGMFVNTLALRLFPGGENRFNQFLGQVKRTVLTALENQDYPFEELVECLDLERDSSRNPLFDVMLVLQNMGEPMKALRDRGLKIRPYEFVGVASRFDMTFIGIERDEDLGIEVEYSTRLFRCETIQRFSRYFKRILLAVVEDPGGIVGEIEMISLEERENILFLFNSPGAKYVVEGTIPRLFSDCVERVSGGIALDVMVGEEGGWGVQVSYGELERLSSCVSRELRQRGVKAGSMVGILANRSVGMIVSILGILKAGAGYVPLNPGAPGGRNEYMLNECLVNTVLVGGDIEGIRGRLGGWEGEVLGVEELFVPLVGGVERVVEEVGAGGIAYVIFTSGSTGQPKGVPVSHRNLVPFLYWGYGVLGLGSRDRMLENLSYYFDWSVWEIMITLTTGAGLCIVPEEVTSVPGSCASYMEKHGVTGLHVTPTQFQYLVYGGRLFSSLSYLFLGAEKLTFDLVRRSFAAVRSGCRLFNMYGPTEATIVSAVLEIKRGDYEKYESLTSIPIGIPVANAGLYIIDAYFNLCPVNVPGELVISGDGVAAGYINNPELTAEKFIRGDASPRIKSFTGVQGAVFQKEPPGLFSFFYKTGDLARWLPDGKIEFLGRIDFQVKIRGFRVELGEIENRLLECEGVAEVVVVDRMAKGPGGEGESGERYLCAYIVRGVGYEEEEEKVFTGELEEYLSRVLPDYMIPSYFIYLEKIPLNANGKVDRRVLPGPVVGLEAEEYLAPGDEIEKGLAEIWSDVLGLPVSAIGLGEHFFRLGGHSLKATVVLSRVQKVFGVQLTLTDMFQKPGLKELAGHIRGSVGGEFHFLELVEEREYYTLSQAQQRLYILDRIEGRGITYNIPMVYRVGKELEIERLEKALKGLIGRHESLRTGFLSVGGMPVQRIYAEVEFLLERYRVEEVVRGEKEEAGIVRGFVRPFDLSGPCLMRAGVVERGSDGYLFMLDMHHIISDGVSYEIFLRELEMFYRSQGERLPGLPVRYRDYTGWQSSQAYQELVKEQESYWINQFYGEIPVLDLPLDYPRPAVQGFEGKTLTVHVGRERTGALKQWAEEENATMFMVLAGLFNILLAKLSGQEDIIIGIPVAGRHHPDLEPVIGMFVNTLAFRHFPVGSKTVKQFLGEVKKQTLAGLEHQDYPFETLVEQVGVKRDVSRNPLFDVMLAVQNLESGGAGKKRRWQGKAEGLDLIPYVFERLVSRFDWTVIVEEQEGELVIEVEYSTILYGAGTMGRFMSYWLNVMTVVIGGDKNELKIGEIDMLSLAEKRQLIEVFNRKPMVYREEMTIPLLFANQVERTPAAVALVDSSAVDQVHVTFKELSCLVNGLAGELIDEGLEPGVMVGLITGRSAEMIVAILAILKVGAAYLPLNPDNPVERNRYMLKDAQVAMVLAYRGMGRGLAGDWKLLELENKKNSRVKEESGRRFPGVLPGMVAYVIYTSGSTGMPKGVPITHANLMPLLHWGLEELGIKSSDRALQNLSYFFDWSVWEIFITLMSGASLCLVTGEVLLNPRVQGVFIERQQITILHLTPTQCNYLVNGNQGLRSLRYLFIGAEKLTADLVERSMAVVSQGCRIFNMYGPTEATIISAVLEIDRLRLADYEKLTSVPIGHPTGNTELFVFDAYFCLTPVQVAGELYIGGSSISSGYLNNPELTTGVFLSMNAALQNRFKRVEKELPVDCRYFYKTGDRVRWLGDGVIEFLGRIDFQVKIRGYRIEMGEIEKRLLEHEEVRDVVLIAAGPGGESEKYLCAYLVGVKNLSIESLRQFLSIHLPEYMIPAVFIVVDSIPLNANGKVDIKRLPPPVYCRGEMGDEYTAPVTGIEKRLCLIWQQVLGVDRVGVHDRFFDLGGNSLKAVQVSSRVGIETGEELPVVALFQYPTVQLLARYLGDKEQEEESIQGVEKHERMSKGAGIAIIGMSCYFPGANDIETFWENLRDGVESITFFPASELAEAVGQDVMIFDSPGYIKAKGLITGAEEFDSSFFGYSPVEAALMDPQVRLFHQCTWAALENAGYEPGTYPGLIGLYAGAAPNFYWEVLARLSPQSRALGDISTLQLADKDFLTTTLSFKLNLKGPSIPVYTGCSTSLVAIDTACRGLLEGQCQVALAGGVALTVPRKTGYRYQEGMIMSSDGHCRAFDAAADGTVAGEGAGVVVLKPLELALEDNDTIWGVIIGTGVNNDGGRKVGFTAPSIEGQVEVIRGAFAMAGIDAETISYIEAHGTGTKLGDPVEIEALKQAFGVDKKRYCPIGTVKSNIGHLDTAAGVAGLIKVVLALQHRQIPPTLHIKTANPVIGFERTPFYPVGCLQRWESQGYPRRAGISSFGIGGTNAHIIVEEAPVKKERQMEVKRPRLLLLSARTGVILEEMAVRLSGYLQKHPRLEMGDVAYTLQVGRKAFRHRLRVVCDSVEEAVEALSSAGSRQVRWRECTMESPRVMFMFPGTSAHYVNMGWDLYQGEGVFRGVMDRCFYYLQGITGVDFKVLVYPGEGKEVPVDLERIRYNQPLLFAFEYALAELVMSWGIRPYGMIGYSLGEYVAACVSGVISLEEGLTLVARRAEAIERLTTGGMLSVPLTIEQLQGMLPVGLGIAIDNGDSCIVAGRNEDIERFEKAMKDRHYLCMRVPVAHPFHTSFMEPVWDELLPVVRGFSFSAPAIPYISNVTGDFITAGQGGDVEYWGCHLRGTVQFAKGMRRLVGEESAVFLEVGPGTDLSAMVRRYLPGKAQADAPVVSLVRPEQRQVSDLRYLLNQVGNLWLYGKTPEWSAFYRGEKPGRISLPGYAFERRLYPVAMFNPSTLLQGGEAGVFFEGAGSQAVEKERGAGLIEARPDLSTVYASPVSQTEEALAGIWQGLFGIERVGIDDDFFELGGDSLKAILVVAGISGQSGKEISLEQFFKAPTIREIGRFLDEAVEKRLFQPVERAEMQEYYPLSPAQKRTYILRHFSANEIVYNEPTVFLLQGTIFRDQVESILRQLIERHESLRTSFHMVDDMPVQKVHEKVEFRLEYRELKPGEIGVGERIEEIVERFVRPFDLAQAPLLRGLLIRESDRDYRLVVDMHHIITDGTSKGVLFREFMAIYSGRALPFLRVHYRDYAVWLNSDTYRVMMAEQEKYWLEQFPDLPPVFDLPFDFSRPAVQRYEGSTMIFELEPGLSVSLKGLGKKEGASLFMVLLAVFNVFLSKLTGHEDIVVGTPATGRRHPDILSLVGMFTATLALRNRPQRGKRFDELLGEVRQNTLGAFENQEYPFEQLVEKLDIVRDASRNPIFDVMFALHNIDEDVREMEYHPASGYLKMNLQPYESQVSKFDISFHGFEKEGRVAFLLEYSTVLFREKTIHRLIRYFRRVVEVVIENPGIGLDEIEITDEIEREELLVLAQGVEEGVDGLLDTIPGRFEAQVEKTPGAVSLVGVVEGVGFSGVAVTDRLTYGELNRGANRLAHGLREKGVGRDVIVGLMVERSMEMVMGMLGILKAGGAYLPIDPHYPSARREYMIKSSGIDILLVNRPIEQDFLQTVVSLEVMDLLDEKSYSNIESNPLLVNQGSDLVYAIYTSGSTGTPKGVLLEHRNLVNLVDFQYRHTSIDFSRVLQFTTMSFDVSFQEIFSTLLKGGTLFLVDEETRRDIPALLDKVERNHILTLFLPVSFLKFIFSREEYGGGFPRRVRHIVTAGEQLMVTESFRNYLQENRVELHNHYGPSETHVVTVLTLQPDGEIPALPSIGRPVANTMIYIMDPGYRLQPMGVGGELLIGGLQVGRGYLDAVEQTAGKFIDIKFKNKPGIVSLPGENRMGEQGQRVYKTGDLACWQADGNIRFLGRLDFQVKIRGFRVEPGEIENRILAFDFIKEVVVMVMEESGGQKRLVAYVVPGPGVSLSSVTSLLRERLSRELPEYMVPAVFIPLEKIPLTPSGKMDRRALPAPCFDEETRFERPVDRVEEKMAQLWSEVLEIGVSSIGVQGHFFELGGHSLKAAVLISKMHRVFDVKITMAEMFRVPRLRDLAGVIKQTAPEHYTPVERVEERQYYPLSPSQERLYIVCQVERETIAYNMPWMMKMAGEIDLGRLEQVFKCLLERHEILRTSFFIRDGEMVQRVEDGAGFGIEYRETDGDERAIAAVIGRFIRPFNLESAPLFRVGIITPKSWNSEKLLVVDIHHIVFDGTSYRIFIKDFLAIYNDEWLVPVRIRYQDYTLWQLHELEKPYMKQQEAWWLQQYAEEVPVLELAVDFSRPTLQDFAGQRIGFRIEQAHTAALKAYALEQGATLFMVLLGVYNILLAKLSGQEDIVVGSPMIGRRHADLQDIMGIFINTLALRNKPGREKSFCEFLAEIKQNTLEAFENQEYPFEDLVDKLAVVRDPGRNPLFDVMFVLQNQEQPGMNIPGVRMTPYNYPVNMAKFDLTLEVNEENDYLELVMEYGEKLFKEQTVRRFAVYFQRIVEQVMRLPLQPLAVIEWLDDEERRVVLERFNDTAVEYPRDKGVYGLFEEQALQTPDKVVAVGVSAVYDVPEVVSLSYGELERRASGLAGLLVKKGAGRGTIVAVMGERLIEILASLLAILKVGGAYLPIDPRYPWERKRYMLADSRASFLIVEQGATIGDWGKEHDMEVIDIRVAGLRGEGVPVSVDVLDGGLSKVDGKDLAYIIYTSGSTGIPKGVMVDQRNIVRLVKNTVYFKFIQGQRIIQTGALEFDASTFEIWGALLNGLTLYIFSREDILNPLILKEAIRQYDIGIMWMTTALFHQVSGEDAGLFSSLKHLLVGGQVLSARHLNLVRQRCPGLTIYNFYGPTENTTFSTSFPIDGAYRDSIPIGYPITNSTVYIMDASGFPVPVGVVGELWVGGEGVARGYLNNPVLTAERFVVDQHSGIPGFLYRTGDLGRWRYDGNIMFIGRMDQQVKIRGFRIELGEIENGLNRYPGIKETVVVTVTDENGDKQLCAYLVVEAGVERGMVGENIRQYLSQQVPDYMIPSYFVLMERLPLNANGKVDIRALPAPLQEKGDRFIAPGHPVEKKLAELWSELLAIEPGKISIDDNFFQLGGHSLKATVLVSRIHKMFNVRVTLGEFFNRPVIRKLAAYIIEASFEQFYSIEPVEDKEYYELSSAQKRMFILAGLNPGSTAYNMPFVCRMIGRVDRYGLDKAFKEMIARHESFRTSFLVIDDRPVQRIHSNVSLTGEYHELDFPRDNEPESYKLIKGFIRPFDLSSPPMVRLGLIKEADDCLILMMDMPHIISDGHSQQVFVREVLALYEGELLPRLRLQYRDFAVWQTHPGHEEMIKEQERYWLELFAGGIPVMELPLDYARGSRDTRLGSVKEFQCETSMTSSIKQLALEKGVTLYMFILAVFNILLARLTGEEDIVLGTPLAGRRHPDLEPIIGMFINTLVLRQYPKKEIGFNQFLTDVRLRTLAAFDNQDYGFDDLVDRLKIQRETFRNPIFDVMFVFGARDLLDPQFASVVPVTPGGENDFYVQGYDFEEMEAKFDILFTGMDTGENLHFAIQYNTALFKENTIERFIQYFNEIMAAIVAHPGVLIKDIVVSHQMVTAVDERYQEDDADFGF